MSSYIESLDRKETIKKAKKRMQHFSDLYRLLCAGYQIPGVSYGSDVQSNGYSNHSQKILHQIEKKDERYAEIEEVLTAMDRLNDKEGEVLFLKYIVMLSNDRIIETMQVSEYSVFKLLREAYFSIAILLQLEVKCEHQ
ncbi:hypothetical protein [Breznakia pachnodae]|uniref:DNA-directed RNA polymerase specialized sigma subunit n=1 Tax=Breznakia pachnodae TaxID=265178 RepID=A0ABU0E6F5_9FIRM|nr:hypothetical protein [Breznakia pachnodae]MDQ0362484.1 DNA-directed RNA polymerase specialized sigma subunit [Breznakia pachnodae]